ncbi:MAG: 4-(cytidine 5'-diphospho)-2-C-methyl-D-erythritol kinase [Bacteroidales bacterium]|nr:4-(cytidine 5'-diphospho)-2-C-methyl-D-erythritol kinase [Bacteroidales bacterium]
MITHPNCKINLGLHVVRRREDGYHDLETIFLPVPLSDELEITPAPQLSFEQDGIPLDSDAEGNLVLKAYRIMQQEFGERIGPVHIRLTKHIPFGAGLGGGSSDAAFALKMLNGLFDMQLSSSKLCRLAARLGADVPFFIDNRAAFATGIGDQLTPLTSNPLKGWRLVLAKPNEAVTTAEAYRGIVPREQRGAHDPLQGDLTVLVTHPVDEWKKLIVNDFEPSVFAVHPRIAQAKEAIYAAGARYAAMSGSGATVFGIFDKDCDPGGRLPKDLPIIGQFEY